MEIQLGAGFSQTFANWVMVIISIVAVYSKGAILGDLAIEWDSQVWVKWEEGADP